MKTAIGLFDVNHDAESAIQTLERAGFARKDISVTVRKTEVNTTESGETMADEGLQTGTLTGMVAGGLMGLLVGAGLLVIPGIGPVLAVGPLAAGLASGSALVGAAAGVGLGAFSGGLIGVLSGMGVPNKHAQIYSEGVRRGGVLVAVYTNESRLSSAEEILRENGAVDTNSREQEYRAEGWDRFDPDAGPHENTNSNNSTSSVTDSNMIDSSVTNSTMIGSNMIGSNMIGSSEPALGAASSVIQHRPEESFNPSSVPGSSGAIDPVTGDDYARSSKLGTAAGAVSGAATGAFVGLAGGPIGTIVGGVIGAVVGGGLGAGLDATAKSEEGQTLMGTGETRDTERTSGWHDHDINSDEDERARAQDTTGLAGVSLEDSIQGTLENPPSDHPESTVDERMERTKLEAENSLRGRIH
jgi:hypothetical protein